MDKEMGQAETEGKVVSSHYTIPKKLDQELRAYFHEEDKHEFNRCCNLFNTVLRNCVVLDHNDILFQPALSDLLEQSVSSQLRITRPLSLP